MRQMKFRMWDTLEKCFMNHSRVIESRVSDLEDNGKKRFVFQQWTGLCDSQGNEIYEGDIVTGINRMHEHKVELYVHFLNGCFMFNNWNAHEFFNKHQFIEVIGNAFENSDLLEESS